jgi:hypothetical protein
LLRGLLRFRTEVSGVRVLHKAGIRNSHESFYLVFFSGTNRYPAPWTVQK